MALIIPYYCRRLGIIPFARSLTVASGKVSNDVGSNPLQSEVVLKVPAINPLVPISPLAAYNDDERAQSKYISGGSMT